MRSRTTAPAAAVAENVHAHEPPPQEPLLAARLSADHIVEGFLRTGKNVPTEKKLERA